MRYSFAKPSSETDGRQTWPWSVTPHTRRIYYRGAKHGDPRIYIPGAIYGAGTTNSVPLLRLHTRDRSGRHSPALIEAMGRGALTLYLDTPENREVAGGIGIPFTHQDLHEKLGYCVALSVEEQHTLRRAAAEPVRERYSWDAVTNAYEQLLTRLVDGQTVHS